jgi:hypothetical protein
VRIVEKSLFALSLIVPALAATLLIPMEAADEVRLKNISTRSVVLEGFRRSVAGFIIEGDASKGVVIRGRGPSINAPNFGDFLEDPFLQLKDGRTLIAENNDWQDDAAQAVIISDLGLAPSEDVEAALFTCLDPGPYTAFLSGNDGTVGVGIVEVFDVDPLGAEPRRWVLLDGGVPRKPVG